MITIRITKDFSPTPGPRRREEGDFSGEDFRETVLWPKLQEAIAEKTRLEVNLDGTAGYGTSFLEEAFGGLIRYHQLSVPQLIEILEFVSKEEPYLIEDIREYIREANQ